MTTEWVNFDGDTFEAFVSMRNEIHSIATALNSINSTLKEYKKPLPRPVMFNLSGNITREEFEQIRQWMKELWDAEKANA